MAKVGKRGRKAPPRVRRKPVAPPQRSGERYELAMRAINEGVYDWDVANRKIHYSQSVYSVLKMPRNLKTPADWRKRIHPDDRAAYAAAIVAHFKQQTKRFECDYRFRATDKTWHWARQRGIALRDRRGRAVRMIGSIGDISDLKRAEEARRQSDERYAFAMRAINEGVYDWNIAEGRTYYSERVVNALGLTQKQLRTAADWHKRIHPEDCPRIDAALVAHFKGDTERFECDYRYRARDGGWRWARQHGIAMRDARGRAVRMIGSTGDINELKLAEIELRRARDEATEALERQTATAEILRVISSTPTDTRPVFDAIVQSALRLFGGMDASIVLVEGDRIQLVAGGGSVDFEERRRRFPIPLDRESSAGRAILDGAVTDVGDTEAAHVTSFTREYGRRTGYRAITNAPLLREGVAIGAIAVTRKAPGALNAKQLDLLQTFADQAVIAIENVRLFNETKEALERQRATADVLASISGSMTDTQPVFDAIVRNLRRLFGTRFAVLQLLRDNMIEMPAVDGEPGFEKLRERYPRPLDETTVGGRAMLSKQAVQFSPVLGNPATPPATEQFARDFGFNSMLFTPMIHKGKVIGAIGTAHPEPKPFDDRQVALIKTFADQAVIAIENVRLFNETKEALEQQTASSQILGVISNSPTDLAPVFDAILGRAVALCGAHYGNLFQYDGAMLEMVASNLPAPANDILRRDYPAPASRDKVSGRVVLSRQVVEIPDVRDDAEYRGTAPKIGGHRSLLGVPLLREGQAIGAIVIARPEPGKFTPRQIAMVQTFADQAVIAIENVRLFNETKESLEQQTATSEVLNVISRSTLDVTPVFQAVVDKAVALCGADNASILQRDSDVYRYVANAGRFTDQESFMSYWGAITLRPGRGSLTGRVALERRSVQIEDIDTDPEYERDYAAHKVSGSKAHLGVPLLKDGEPVGLIIARRFDVRPFADKQIRLLETFAAQAVIAIENVRLFNETKEALEQQTATAEILKVIASSPSDVQPVFDAIAESAMRLFAGQSASVTRVVGDTLHLAALTATSEAGNKALNSLYPAPLSSPLLNTEVARSGKPAYRSDVESDPGVPPEAREMARVRGFRSILAVPMLREGVSIGTINVTRSEPGPFTDHQINLLKTFAHQAVIAIENVRLFNETKEALERQTATAEILKVISSSPTDVQPVFDTIVRSVVRLCDGLFSGLYRFEGELIHHVAQHNFTPEALEEVQRIFPARATRALGTGRAILERAVVHIPDVEVDPEHQHKGLTRAVGMRSGLFVPMLREGDPIGVIMVARAEPGPFSDNQIDLLKTFADQAVIAIENVRLFNETKESLEQQTAISEILRVISNSPSDVQPVLDAVAERAARICAAQFVDIVLAEGETMRFGAAIGAIGRPGATEPVPLDRTSVMGRSIVDRATVHVADLQNAPESEFPLGQMLAHKYGHRTILAVPLVREDRALGTIVLRRTEVRPFDDKHIALLKTFADQAAIAIENVRLFNETREALERQTATAEILKVISSSPNELRPVFDAILEKATHLCDAHLGTLGLYDGERYQHMAQRGATGEYAAWLSRPPFVPDPRTSVGRMVAECKAVHHADIRESLGYREGAEGSVKMADLSGGRSYLAVPMAKEGRVVGGIVIYRREVRPFTQKQIDLLSTFASQAVIAIDNVRLFNETKESLERQTATAEILKVIASSPTDVQPVFDVIVESAVRLCGASFGRVYRYDGSVIDMVASHGLSARGLGQVQRVFPRPAAEDTIVGVVVLTRRPFFLSDIDHDDRVPALSRQMIEALDTRSQVTIPMLRAGESIGAITMGWKESGGFGDQQVALLQTFADQAVIAIENVRLFNETKEALERQTATAEILKVIGSSPTDAQPVFEAIVRSALRVFDGMGVGITLLERNELHSVAEGGNIPRPRADFRMPLDRESTSGRAILDRSVVSIPDTEAPEAPAHARANARASGYRSMAGAPMMRKGEAVGGIVVMRPNPGALSDKQLDLLRTFADQAVIAIENVRLFKELQSRTEALTRSVGQLTALGEVGQAISSTLDLETVLKTIVARAVQLTGLDGGSIYEYDERAEEFHLRATENVDEEYLAVLRQTPIRKGEGAVGRAALTGEPVQIADVMDASYQTRLRDALIRAGYRAVLVVPLRREEHVIGALSVTRKAPGPFAPEIVELLKTFATQSAMAIQNARLFREIAEKGKQLEVASRHKSDFLASMSHELRTPLNAILGFNEMILGQVYGEVPKDMQEPLADIQTSGKHLLRLINNVLDLAKIEAGRMELALSDYSVHDTVESVRSTLRPLAAEKGLELLADVPNDMPLAYGDPGRITQCLMNLAGNSLKFTKAGKVEISVEAKGDLLVYKVADTGIGIAPDKLETVFAEFKQTDATIASEYGGTGLGLSISRKFVEMHGGRIWVESELGKGSAFIFEVPLRVKTT